MIIRVFDTTMEPEDIERAKQIFREIVKPAFASFPGCHGIDMYLGIDEHSGDLVDVAAISRWESMEAITAAIGTKEYDDSLEEIRKLFQQTPIVRHFDLAE